MTAGSHRAGIRYALLAAILFGLSTPLAKLLLRGISPQVLAGLLYTGSGLGLGAYWLVWGRWTGREARLSRRDLPWLAGVIAAGGLIAPVLLMAGLSRTPASAASLLLNLEGVFTAALAWVVFHENVDRRIFMGMTAIIAGGLLLSWSGGMALAGPAGPLLIGAACFGWAVDNNLTQRVAAGDPVQIAAMKGIIAGSVNLVLGVLLGARVPGWPEAPAALAVGLAGYGVSLALYVRGMRDLGTARTGAYFSLAPFIGSAAGLLLFREPITSRLLGAAGLMGLGLWLHLTERHEHDHLHEPMRHTHRHVHDEHHQHAHGPDDPSGEPHTHEHFHPRLMHRHPHYPDIHHRHPHS
jgi:drug/metabolite transporter (DMT)-like permease